MSIYSLLVVFIVLGLGVVVPGAIGASISRAWGYPAGRGFLLGGLGGIGGWMLVAARPKQRIDEHVHAFSASGSNPETLHKTLRVIDFLVPRLYHLSGVLLAVLNAWWLSLAVGAALFPFQGGPVLQNPGRLFSFLSAITAGAVLLIWLLSLFTAVADRRLSKSERIQWTLAQTVLMFVGALLYVPWRRTKFPEAAVA